MSIEFSEIFTSFTTERYNKANLLNFILCMVFAAIIIGVSKNIIAGIVIYSLIYIIFCGYLALMSHNEALSSKNVVPAINKIGEIITVGFKYLTGVSTLIIIFCLPLFLCLAIMIGNITNVILSRGAAGSESMISNILVMMLGFFIFGIMAIILIFKYAIPAQLLFMQTLNLSDMFSYKKIAKYGKMISKDYWMYILFTFLISMMIGVVVQSIAFLLTGIYTVNGIFNAENAPTAAASTENYMQYIYQNLRDMIGFTTLFTEVQYVFFVLFMPNLNGQIIKNVLKRTLKRNDI